MYVYLHWNEQHYPIDARKRMWTFGHRTEEIIHRARKPWTSLHGLASINPMFSSYAHGYGFLGEIWYVSLKKAVCAHYILELEAIHIFFFLIIHMCAQFIYRTIQTTNTVLLGRSTTRKRMTFFSLYFLVL
jgi:hypothetical protein